MKTLKITILFLAFVFLKNQVSAQTFYKQLQDFSDEVSHEFDQIETGRKEKLDSIASSIYDDWVEDKMINIQFICTHNSRRSHMASLWFQAATYYYGLTHFYSFSGGTEITAFNKRAVSALERAGFKSEIADSSTSNIVYIFKFGERYPETKHFSKIYSHKSNPQENFSAIMVCSDADTSCPLVPGADNRYSLPFKDPRYFDNTASEKAEYDKTCRIIAREMFYLVYQVKHEIVVYQESKK